MREETTDKHDNLDRLKGLLLSEKMSVSKD